MNELGAQCSIPSQVPITDKDTTLVSFVIEGAQLDDLSLNGVCGFNIEFSHDFLGDVSIILVSPSGQEVQLIGPSLQTSPNTQFITWDVSFIPCGFSPNPDAGILPVWYNINNWFAFTEYTGSYYPAVGCLEDLNSGPVNGLWTIKIIDAVEFGSGIIEDMNIIFCDPSGIDCSSCVADAGDFSISSLDYCEGQEELRIFPNVEYSGPEPSLEDYVYKYIVLNDNVSSIVDSIDLRTSAPGTYEVCGLSVSSLQANSLPSINGVTTKSEYELILENNLACAALTPSCITVQIKDVQDTILLSEFICLGSSIDIDGQSYTEPGTYIVGYSGPMCDTMTILELDVFNINAEIDPQIDSLTCLGNTVMLDGSMSTADDVINYRWFTSDGLIRSDTNGTTVQVSQVGTYNLEIESNNCKDTASIQVVADESFIELDFNHNVLDCNNQSSLIDMTSSQPLTFVRWDGPSAFSRVGDNIVVSDPGTYLVTVTSVDGCTSFDSVQIVDGFDIIDPMINPNDITCVNPSINTGVTIADDSGLSYQWTGPSGFTSSELDPLVSEGGVYTININSDNGCTETWNVIIDDTRQFPVLTTSTDTLDCANPQVNIGVMSSITSVTYQWSGPNSFTSDIAMPLIDQDGLYTVVVTTDQQCQSSIDINVERDERLPSLIANDILIECSDAGSTNLSVITDANDPTFSWQGPGDYQSFAANPTAGYLGTYTVTVMGSNGCPRSGSLNLLPGIDVPDVDFSSDTIDCDEPLQLILPSDTTDLQFTYVSDSGTTITDQIPLTGEAGMYRIRVTDQSGCFSDYIHEVKIDTITPLVNLSSLEIDCNNDSVRLALINSIPIRSYTWTGPSGFNRTIKEPFTDVPGTYKVDFVGVNGCQNSDSIEVRENFNVPVITPRNSFITCASDIVAISVGVDMNPSTYDWTGPDGFISTEVRPQVLEAGTYNVTVTGPNGCVNSDFLMVGYDTIAPTLTLVNDGFLTCPDPIVTLSGTSSENDISITWYGPDIVIPGGLILDVESPGVWILEAIDTAGCVTSTSVVVNTEIDYPDITVDYNDIDCNIIFSKIEVQAGPLTENIFWTAPVDIQQDITEFNTDVAGVYEIMATGINGCDTLVTFEILKDTIPPEFVLEVSDTITCATPQVTISANSMSSLSEYNWIGPNGFVSTTPDPSVNHGGRYIFQTRGVNGCSSVDTIFVALDTIHPAVQGMAEDITCIASKATLDVLTNISDAIYSWSGPNNFTSDEKDPIAVTAGTYTIEVTSRSNGCSSSDEVELISDTQAPRIILDSISYLLCDSSGVNLEVTSDIIDAEFIWFGDGFFSDEQRPFIDTTGKYTVYATGPNGCRSLDTTRVVVDTRLPDFLVASTDINCQESMGNIIAESVNDDLSFQWQGPNGFTSAEPSVEVADSGTYFMIVQGNNLCIDTQSVHVAIDRYIPTPVAQQAGILQCTVTEINLDGSNSSGVHAISYNWTTADGTIITGENSPRPLIGSPGSYTLEVIDNTNKCSADTTITVVRTEQEFDDFILLSQNPSCIGFQNGQISFSEKVGGYGQLLFSFEGGPFNLKDEFQFLDPGTYSIIARDSLGCELSKEVTLFPPRDISIDVGEDRTVDLGSTTDLIINTNVPPDSVDQIIWSDTSALICTKCLFQTIQPIKSTLYEVELIDVNGCSVTDEVLITVPTSINIQLPNVIRPTSTSGNDVFFIAQTKGIKHINFLSIFDRWGNRMFHAEDFGPGDENIGWDGTFLDKPALPGVYPLVAEFILDNGETLIHHADLTVIR
ncbi:MAG: hypothetical protein HKN68_22220 [Saprospiraceae bacterium]|nr:hypothetical protein [Saprospiraceae bacterium]